MLQRERFRAVRAFQVEEFEDEGSQYFIELEDGRVLFLVGQYMDGHGPCEAWGNAPATPRAFPCVEFEVLRHRVEKYALDVACHGAVLEPECVAPSFGDNDDFPPEDGTLISDRSYDEIKTERLKPKIHP
ncbi:MAG: hypothetical protein FWF96_04265 [Kiritimatiellaeota bacterium]|nr:hypothetical protein [Kiritimatiellota bacterium]